MEVRVKPWCCSLDTAVGVVGGCMAALYLMVGVEAVCLGGISHVSSAQMDWRVVEVDSFDDVYDDLDRFEESDKTFIFLVLTLIISILGIVSSLLLVMGVVRRSSCMLLPWLTWHVVIILVCIGSGLYLVVYFLLLAEDREEDKAIISATPIIAGIFLIFLWVLVDQLYLQLGHTKLTVAVDNNLRKSSSHLGMGNKEHSNTLRSTRSQQSLRSLRPLKKRSNHQEFNRKSRSLEYILDSNSDSSNSTYQSEIISCKLQGLTTLPRLHRCRDNPDTFRAYNHAGNTDTVRSSKSVASGKSVAIHPQVIEYHYEDHQEEVEGRGNKDIYEWENGVTIDFSDEADDSLDIEEKETEIIPALPPPIYPSLDSRKPWTGKFGENKKIFTKDQIIDFYCPQETKIG